MSTAEKKPKKDKAQSRRFIEAAREAGCSEDKAEIRENIKLIARPNVPNRSPGGGNK